MNPARGAGTEFARFQCSGRSRRIVGMQAKRMSTAIRAPRVRAEEANVRVPISFLRDPRPLFRRAASPLLVLLLSAAPLLAQAPADPWSRAVQVMRTFFTGPFAQGVSLIAVVIGGAMYAMDEGGGNKKRVATLVFGVGLMLLAAQFLTWMFGVTT